MIRPGIQRSVKVASGYFREHLKVGDYYTEKSNVRGEWFGSGAARLGLVHGVSERGFQRMCEGKDPRTGDRLIARLNGLRVEQGRRCPNRRVGFDFVFSPSKGVSVLAECGDERVKAVHDDAVKVALGELEKFVATRVRRNGANDRRMTQNFVAALFRHDTSREGDPHLHTHAFVFNATFDGEEGRWKALEPSDMYRAQRYADACYQHRLREGLLKLGHMCMVKDGRVEVCVVTSETAEKFSKRHAQIDEIEKANGVEAATPAERYQLRERIARESRAQKDRDQSLDDLKARWLAEMTPKERDRLAFRASRRELEFTEIRTSVKRAIDVAEAHLFERNAVVHDRDLVAHALLSESGRFLSTKALWAEVRARPYVRDELNPERISLAGQSKIERELVELVDRTRGRHDAINPDFLGLDPRLDAEQAHAVRALLESRHGTNVLRGKAGTGKSFTLNNVVAGARAGGRDVVVVAPQNQQVRELQRDGLEARTVESLLMKRDLPHGGVLIVDEAGQLSARRMVDLVRLCALKQARLILSGDTRQHGAIEATDALSLLEDRACLPTVELSKIRRQDPTRGNTATERLAIRSYRDAVAAASNGDTQRSLRLLETEKAVIEVTEPARVAKVAEAYVQATERGDRVLAIGQTWNEVNQLNQAIRANLQSFGKVSGSVELETLQNLNLTLGQRMEPGTYQHCRDLVFVRSYGRFKKGERVEVAGATAQGLRLMKNGKETVVGYSKADRFMVVRPRRLKVGVGDHLQLKFNGKSEEGRTLANGELVRVEKVQSDGRLVVRDDSGVRKTLGADQRIFNHGYAVTSYGSQGKTVDTVLFSDAGAAGATNQKQWYVTISRGRRQAKVFTSDLAKLRESIQRDGDRDFALQERPISIQPKPAPTVVPTIAKEEDFDAMQASRERLQRFKRHQFVRNHIARQQAIKRRLGPRP